VIRVLNYLVRYYLQGFKEIKLISSLHHICFRALMVLYGKGKKFVHLP